MASCYWNLPPSQQPHVSPDHSGVIYFPCSQPTSYISTLKSLSNSWVGGRETSGFLQYFVTIPTKMLHLVKLRFKEVERLGESPRGRDDKAETGFEVLQFPSLPPLGCLPERIEPSSLCCIDFSACRNLPACLLLIKYRINNSMIPIGYVCQDQNHQGRRPLPSWLWTVKLFSRSVT